MSNPYGSSSIPLLPTNPASSVALPLPNFLSEISGFSTALGTFTAGILEVAALHDSALLSTESETAYGSGASARLEAKVAECSSQAKQLKDVVKYLERDVLLTEREASVSGDMSAARTKRAQAEKARRDLQAALREFETMERTYGGKYRDLMARQYRIVNPQATDEEIAAAVESGQTQVFSQALLSSNRSASANSVARAVRERQQDIQRIEKTLEELLVLFEQMEEQVVLAEPMLERIEDKSHNATEDLERANTQLAVATKSARSWRKNKWICLGIGVLILLVIVIIIVIVVVLQQQKNKAAV